MINRREFGLGLLASLATVPALARARPRIVVLSGWFGRPFNPGMANLAEQLSRYGDTTFHSWKDVGAIYRIVEATRGKLAIIGFSLGANDLGLIGQMSKRRIDLGIAYDPSKSSPLVYWDPRSQTYVQRAPRYDRFICYYHPTVEPFGGSRYIGDNVETVTVHGPHILMQFRQDLHDRTIREVARL